MNKESAQYWKEHQAEFIRNLVESNDFGPVLRDILLRLRSGHYRDRKDAVLELVKYKDLRVVSVLIAVSGDCDPDSENPKVNWAASEALMRMGEIAVKPVIEFVERRLENECERRGRYFILWA